MKTVALDRRIANVLKKFISSTGEDFQDSIIQAIIDYVNILNHVRSGNPDRDLERIISNFEVDVQIVFKKMKQARYEYLQERREEAILLDRELPIIDNRKYIFFHISDEIHEAIEDLISDDPYIYDSKKKASIKDVINRASLFRAMKNDTLMKNDIYRAWRLEMLIEKEKEAKIHIDNVLEIVSKKRKVVWDE